MRLERANNPPRTGNAPRYLFLAREHPVRATIAIALWVFAIGLPVGPAFADNDSLRCPNGLVEKGDPAIAVRNACGRPDFVDPWIASGAYGYGAAPSMEEWTYNRGPSRLLRILLFRNGRLFRIRNGDYGFGNNAGRTRCRPSDIFIGMSKYQLLHACGQPDQQSGHFVYSSVRRSGGRTFYLRRGVVPVYRERWIYNFGAARLLREVTLENAVVVATDTGRRGFDR